MRVLAIDPGFERVGIAVVEKKNGVDILIFSSCFMTDKNLAFSERLVLIGEEVERIINKYSPNTLAIETLFFNTNQKTALKVSEARGVSIYTASKKGLSLYEYSPLQIKIAITGYGKATKAQVSDMTHKLIIIQKKPKYDDETDAIAVGLTCLASEKNV